MTYVSFSTFLDHSTLQAEYNECVSVITFHLPFLKKEWSVLDKPIEAYF